MTTKTDSVQRTSIVDCCRFAAVEKYQDIFQYMPVDWRKRFDRYEWIGSIDLATNHIRVSDKFRHEPPPRYLPASNPDQMALVVPNQGISVNGWTDPVAADVFLNALNTYAEENWSSPSSKVAMVANPFDPRSAAAEIRRRAASNCIGAVAIPLVPTMLGSRSWDPVYEACVDLNLPVTIHFSGVEGSYAGTAPLSGAAHTSPLSRLILMPHLAESNVASLVFEGAFYRFPDLQMLFAGFGFKWIPSLLRRIDQEWRNFRSDMPWVKERPSSKFLSNLWVSSYPVGEAVNQASWIGEFGEGVLDRIVFSSNAPFDGDTVEDAEAILGKPWIERLMRNGRAFMRLDSKAETRAA